MASTLTLNQLLTFLNAELEVNLVGKQSNVPGDLLDTINHIFQFITVHETANKDIGANARMHRNFVKNGGGSDTVSFTFAVDSQRIVQILPINQAQYAQGTARGNYISISIEMCINADGDFIKTVDNTCKLIASLMVLAGKSNVQSTVLQHNYWYGKDCPSTIRHTVGAWDTMLAKVGHYMEVLTTMGNPNPTPIPVDQEVINGFTVKQGFYGLWKKYGLEVLGLPLSNEYTVKEPALDNMNVQYQDFENAMVQWYPGISPRICAGIRMLKYE